MIIDEMAGVIGIDPGPLTLRSLTRMARARASHNWDQTALIAMILAESNRNEEEKREPFTVSDFHPYMDAEDQTEPEPDAEHIGEARSILKPMSKRKRGS